MADRILRDEVWLSDRFLDLPTDATRLAFLRFISLADCYGNFEGGPRRVYRVLAACTQIKTEADAALIVDSLMLAELLRRYEIEGKEFFHVPRFNSGRTIKVRRYPPSPWCLVDKTLGAHSQKKTNREESTPSPEKYSSSSVALHPGVGVGVGVGKNKSSANATAPVDNSRAIELANALLVEGIKVTPQNQTLLAMLADGYDMTKILPAIAIARQRKPAPAAIPINYLDRIVRDPPKAQTEAWWSTDSGMMGMAKKFKVSTIGKQPGQLKQDILVAMKKQAA